MRTAGLRDSDAETICTCGVSRKGVRDPRTFENRFYAYAVPFVWLLPEADAETGMDAVIARTVQRIPTTSVDPTVKNFHWADLTRGLYEAYDRGARYPILLDADGHVTEGAGYNVFALVDGRLLTPASGTLEGITRRTVMELAEREGIPAELVALPEATFRQGAELFATTTAGRRDADHLAGRRAGRRRDRRARHPPPARAVLGGPRGPPVRHAGRLRRLARQ